jgi:hypothetical protein
MEEKTPLIFCASCVYLAYSSIMCVHSKGAVTILMYVMIAGVVGLILLRLKKLSRRRFIEAPI